MTRSATRKEKVREGMEVGAEGLEPPAASL